MASVARGAAGDLPAMELEDRVVAAAGAAVASALITNPMDVVKTRLQYQAAQINRFNTTQRGSGNVHSQNISVHAKKPASPKQQHFRSHGVPLPRLGSSSGQLSNLSCGCVVAEAGACVSHVGRAPASCGVFSGTLDAARKIVRTEGMRVLWRGTPAALAMAIPQVGIYMPTYEALKRRLEDGQGGQGALPALIAGTTARGLAVLITSPLERYRTRAQAFAAQGSGASSPPRQSLPKLWKGTVATLLRDVPFSGIYWVVTEAARRRLREAQGGGQGGVAELAYVNLLSGTIGGTVAASITTPLDVVKTRIQTDIMQDEAKGSSTSRSQRVLFSRDRGVRQVAAVMQRIATEEGAARLFDGAAARAARAAPSCAIVLTSYEILKAIMAKF